VDLGSYALLPQEQLVHRFVRNRSDSQRGSAVVPREENLVSLSQAHELGERH
jgi:hypothetical protein